MIKGINESKILMKHISCQCRCEFDDRKCNSKQNWNSTYTKSLIDDLVVLCDEILDTPNIVSVNSTKKTNHLLLGVALLATLCLKLLVVITVKYYIKHGLAIPCLLSY